MADAHKWMLGPEGIALFYCRQAVMERLDLKQYGWHMLEDLHNFDSKDWEIAGSARRFECGSPNMTGIVALHASTGLLLEIGMDRIEQMVLDKSAYLIEQLNALDNIELLSPVDDARRSGIVLFRKAGVDTEALYRHLQQHNVICAMRGNGIRFSPHFYTPEGMIDTAVSLLAEFQ